MKFALNTDTVTTGIGLVLAAGTAAQPVLAGVAGSMHQGDWIQLVIAIGLAIQGYFTNKKSKEPTDVQG